MNQQQWSHVPALPALCRDQRLHAVLYFKPSCCRELRAELQSARMQSVCSSQGWWRGHWEVSHRHSQTDRMPCLPLAQAPHAWGAAALMDESGRCQHGGAMHKNQADAGQVLQVVFTSDTRTMEKINKVAGFHTDFTNGMFVNERQVGCSGVRDFHTSSAS